MSTNKFQYWPSDGQLGSTKFTMPTNAEDWPNGDALIGNFVYNEGELVDLVDTKGLTPNTSKSTTIPYDYVNIELPFAEDAMTINRGPRNKYLIIKFNDKEVEEGGNVIVTLKYKNCKTVDDVKAVDPDYLTNDIIDGVWSEGLGDLEQGSNGKYNGGMFYYCTNLTSFSSDLSSLTNGDYMFYYCTILTSFNSDLSSLTNGDYMFNNCNNLTSFSSDLSNLTSGGNMFNGCDNLTSFNFDLSNLTNGKYMFEGCSNLSTFTSDLHNLTNGDYMFNNCNNLTSFSSDLSNLTSGGSMFYKCKLDAESIMYIADTIKDITAEKQLYIDGTIPYVTLSNGVYSATRGFMSDGKYVYTYNNPKPYTATISASKVGKLTLGINVTNNTFTIQQQLEDFAKAATFDSWSDLKTHFSNKGWTVTFQYGGTNTSITYGLRGGEQIIPCSIFAKLVEADKDSAEYCTEDALTFYNIEWGHDVTDTSSYTQFNSLEEAIEHFNIKPIERNS